jgi:hypothetical protein
VQSNAWVLDRFARAPLQARLERLAMPNVTALEAELDRPVPQGAHDLGSDLPEARRNDRGSRGRVRTETSAPAVG